MYAAFGCTCIIDRFRLLRGAFCLGSIASLSTKKVGLRKAGFSLFTLHSTSFCRFVLKWNTTRSLALFAKDGIRLGRGDKDKNGHFLLQRPLPLGKEGRWAGIHVSTIFGYASVWVACLYFHASSENFHRLVVNLLIVETPAELNGSVGRNWRRNWTRKFRRKWSELIVFY